MENGGFQSQVLSVMEVLAKAAVAEINRRVDDSCALLRLEVSQSRRDIALLKRKCEAMEAELRRTRMRAKRKAAETLCPLTKERPRSDWEAQAPNQAQRADADEAEHVLVKEECSEDDLWKNNPENRLTSGTEEPCCQTHQSIQNEGLLDHYPSAEKTNSTGPTVSPADGYDTFPEQLNQKQSEQEIVVKVEKEEPDENAAPLDSGHRFVTQDVDSQLWSNGDTGESELSCEVEQISSADLQEMVQKSLVVSATRMKRRIRMFGCKRPQTDEALVNASDQISIPQQSWDQDRNSVPPVRDPNQVLTAPVPAASALCGCSCTSFSLARRMRAPWMSGIGEKRFNCTYCDKSFMRFSQLKEHQRSHTGEKPFSCLLCGRSFTKQCNLIRHAVVHSGEKPHECSLCGKCFTQRSSLKSHQKTAH